MAFIQSFEFAFKLPISNNFYSRQRQACLTVCVCVFVIKWMLVQIVEKFAYLNIMMSTVCMTTALHITLSKCDFIMIVQCSKMFRSLHSYFKVNLQLLCVSLWQRKALMVENDFVKFFLFVYMTHWFLLIIQIS